MITKEELMEAIKQVVREEIVQGVVKHEVEGILGRDSLGIDYLRAMVKKVVQEEIWGERWDIREKTEKEIKDAR